MFSKSMLEKFKVYSSIHLTKHYETPYIIHGLSLITLQSSAPAELLPHITLHHDYNHLHLKSHVLLSNLHFSAFKEAVCKNFGPPVEFMLSVLVQLATGTSPLNHRMSIK